MIVVEMKLRLQGNSLRLRLGRSEVARLRDIGSVEEAVSFKTGGCLTYRIQTGPDTEILRAEFAAGVVTIRVPSGMAQAWASSDEVGLYVHDGDLAIAIEKDFRCLTRAEDQPDAFPRPAAG